MKNMGAFLGALAVILFSAGLALADHADLVILSPEDGQAIKAAPNTGATVVVKFEVQNFRIGDFTKNTAIDEHEGHLHIQLDDQPYNTIHTADSAVFVYVGVKPGPHILIADLVHNDHSLLNKKVGETISFSGE